MPPPNDYLTFYERPPPARRPRSANMVHLPVELWLQILRWATLSYLTPRLRATEYHPFQTAFIDVSDDALKTKRTIVLVCKLWRLLALDLMYEDVVITPDTFRNIWADEGEREVERRRYVRRAYLPYSSTVTVSPKALKANDILCHCPQLEVLVRGPDTKPDDLRFEFSSECPALRSLRRLDWWHHNEATRAGGINSLSDVLLAAPNLEYLSLGGDVWLSLMRTSSVDLPSLTTLRLRRMNVLFIQQICRWKLPALTHLVIDTVANIVMLESLWETFGSQIRTLELGTSLKYYVSDSLSLFLPQFPNLKELNYYIHFTAKPCPLPEQHLSLTTIGVHALPNSFFAVGSKAYWEHIEDHFAVYCRPSFPALKKIILYGDWAPVLNDDRCPSLLRPLYDRGYAVEWQKI